MMWVVDLLAELLGRSSADVPLFEPLKEIGVDSLAMFELACRLEELGVDLDVVEAHRLPELTAAELASKYRPV